MDESTQTEVNLGMALVGLGNYATKQLYKHPKKRTITILAGPPKRRDGGVNTTYRKKISITTKASTK